MKTKEMTQANIVQPSRLATMLGGGLYVANMAIWHPISEPLLAGTPLGITFPLGHAIHHAPELPAYALLAIGLAGLARRQANSLDWAGKIGLYLSMIGFALMAVGTFGIVLFEGVFQISVDALETIHPLLLLPLIGSIFYGLTMLKTKLLPSEGAWLIIVASLMFLGLIFSGIIDTAWGYWVGKGVLALFSAGWTWLGYAFWSEGHQPLQPTVS